ncbi:NAD(P)H-hydrate dehydratase [Lysobacter solisilvae (ex Woo and Kim 2020)]|uniref:Bifunctional NAD(P)H-hydrate repair enzyme n=1 Tax=Agrilutibacter terrestris TaxID=2865112 RepID=A0A7H0FWC8_9GAMM|nr:NAD(P)H-hydrate dehydratase [Lysobacter terrestris]QNP40344.1 NAD(P)H-hydrate dehydratase [Lysobacter terrestris]
MPGIFPLFDCAALRGVEGRAAAELGDAFELMRRAGQAAWRELLAHWPQAQRIVVVCGPGNNGGDGYVLARHALMAGRQVDVVRLAQHAPRSELAMRAAADYEAAGGRVQTFEAGLSQADVVIDALFGIGLSRAPDVESTALIEAINRHDAPVFSLDAPSGVDCDRGSVPGTAVFAARTLEFIASKTGLHTGAALDHVGITALATLELSPHHIGGAAPAAELVEASQLARWLQPRRRDSHKGSNGRVLCVGGDHGGGGAILLCAEAALRCGAGLVDVATRPQHVTALLTRTPEVLAHALDDSAGFAALLEKAGVVALGPGLGQGAWGRALQQQCLASGKALVLDADALNLLASSQTPLPDDSIITPHPGEAARLLDSTVVQVQVDRCRAARELAARYRCTVVLKGAGSIVAAPDRLPCVIGAGNPGMATGGMGDVLTGTIAALRAQGLPAFDAACAGALLHAAAGDAAADNGERGLLPSDLMPWLRRFANAGTIP